MEQREVPQIQPQESEKTVLANYSYIVEGKDGVKKRGFYQIVSNPDGEHPFKAIDPTTEQEVPLSPTRLVEVYSMLQMTPPPKVANGVEKYHKIKRARHIEKIKKQTPIETPPEH